MKNPQIYDHVPTHTLTCSVCGRHYGAWLDEDLGVVRPIGQVWYYTMTPDGGRSEETCEECYKKTLKATVVEI
jgi:hypothetical protein